MLWNRTNVTEPFRRSAIGKWATVTYLKKKMFDSNARRLSVTPTYSPTHTTTSVFSIIIDSWIV